MGLSPVINIRQVSDGALVVNGSAMAEVGDGFYRFDFSAATNGVQYAILCDSVTLSGSERYVYAGGDADNTADFANLTRDVILSTESQSATPIGGIRSSLPEAV